MLGSFPITSVSWSELFPFSFLFISIPFSFLSFSLFLFFVILLYLILLSRFLFMKRHACIANIEKLPEFDDHKLVSFFADRKTGLRAFVAIHNDNLGPATGGTRMWAYATEADALCDVLNLSRAMTYKCALAGVHYGGGKGVIIGNSETMKTPALLFAYAGLLYSGFKDIFSTGTDVGLTDDDVKIMSAANPHIIGVLHGDKLSTSDMATLGVFSSILGVFEEAYRDHDLSGKTFAVKGLGKTGMELVRFLTEAGAHVVAAEINKKKVALARKQFPTLRVVSPAIIHKQKVDVYCPCALGGDITSKTVRELRCRFIVGSANNQLASTIVGATLHKKGILYVPDYVANAGGLINVVDELEKGGYRSDRVLTRVKNIKRTIRKIIARSQKEKQPTNLIADRMAEEIFSKKRRT
ncbi:MAG: hypothetical protein COU08_01385 [Candidatus Harrisonbacteria bacterium CG10_big_fil_rev_8_21_14_0_10_42_17]|uniref:Glutamate/phenylalanine/leucine/valine/L-tryptophan dehydrogenase C-terminal domain-containing protein n=1 Tax=Candidatus Harrisonbacteria bacterium CG10_big_fil_rev_8_21_14_0_10_42_17 TaxID=1974584 RepID=A0A2M6WIK5_9BACT|nr:MAG: hypothetical protein COU08_01385 [Candidatus Harrisonbacteria bacterium CG10_big_fil_rev_8_21_14_0_10_42_17]